MLLVPQPSMALNASDVPGAHFQMWNTRLVQEEERIGNVLDNIASVADCTYNKKLQVLIINSHGFYAEANSGIIGGFGIALGTGINLSNVDKFSKIADKVNQIWIKACGVARIANIGRHGDGNLFCSKLAQASQSYVIAPTQMQDAPNTLPPFYSTDWNGLVLCYNPQGAVEWSRRYEDSSNIEAMSEN